MVGAVGGGLLCVNVIGKQTGPSRPQPDPSHAAARKEIIVTVRHHSPVAVPTVTQAKRVLQSVLRKGGPKTLPIQEQIRNCLHIFTESGLRLTRSSMGFRQTISAERAWRCVQFAPRFRCQKLGQMGLGRSSLGGIGGQSWRCQSNKRSGVW